MSGSISEIREELFSMRDEEYKSFAAKLIPNIPAERIIGVRIPVLRAYSRRLSATDKAHDFLLSLPHEYYDENNLHAFLIEGIRNFDLAIDAIDRFLPYVDNWSTCDTCSPKVLKKYPAETLEHIKRWLDSEHVYTVRFGIGRLLADYLDEQFSETHLEAVAAIHSNEYYINMMIAWYFATALAKQYDAAFPYISEHRLEPWTHDKTIQKALESRRISNGKKTLLRELKLNKWALTKKY